MLEASLTEASSVTCPMGWGGIDGLPLLLFAVLTTMTSPAESSFLSVGAGEGVRRGVTAVMSALVLPEDMSNERERERPTAAMKGGSLELIFL
jgi:hypothetical protein